MTSNPDSESLQSQVLRAYSTLLQLRSDWGGSFILSLGLSAEGSALAIGSNIAGAVSLSIDGDAANLREVVRSGAVDFVVHSLDEAVRAMKNEIRKRTPLSVALSAPPLKVLDEIAARGLAPQLFASYLPPDPRILDFTKKVRALGADLVDFEANVAPIAGFRSSRSILDPLLVSRSWHLCTYSFQTSAELREFDRRALEHLPPDDTLDTLRRRWLEAASRILQRQKPPHRCLWLSTAEQKGLF